METSEPTPLGSIPDGEDLTQPQQLETRGKKPPEFPCLVCGKNVGKGSVQCTLCMLWCHKVCTHLSKEAFKGLEVQAKETGTAYWACKSCLSFAQKINHQFKETNRRQEEMEARVEVNTRKINNNEREVDKLKQEVQDLRGRLERDKEARDETLCEELREQNVRRLNIIIHGVQEAGEEIRDNRARIEMDRDRCGDIFNILRVKTRKEDLRFCRRIGERSRDNRPLCVGLHSEEDKRAILASTRELRGSKYDNVSVVPDLTRMQRKGEDKLTREAEVKNNSLSGTDVEMGLKWMVVGRRGEKRLIKGRERDSLTHPEGMHGVGNRGGRPNQGQQNQPTWDDRQQGARRKDYNNVGQDEWNRRAYGNTGSYRGQNTNNYSNNNNFRAQTDYMRNEGESGFGNNRRSGSNNYGHGGRDGDRERYPVNHRRPDFQSVRYQPTTASQPVVAQPTGSQPADLLTIRQSENFTARDMDRPELTLERRAGSTQRDRLGSKRGRSVGGSGEEEEEESMLQGPPSKQRH